MKEVNLKRLKFRRWLLRVVLGKQLVYVISTSLYKSQKEADLIGNHIRSKFLGDILKLFDD